MDVFDAILSAQGGLLVRQMGARAGVDADQAQAALQALLPALAGAASRNAAQPGGLEALLGALAGGRHGRYLDDPAVLCDDAATVEGNAILGHLLGSKDVSRELAARASAQTGLGADVLKQMLPLVATLLMGGLSKGVSGGSRTDAGAGGLGQVLGAALGGMSGGGQAAGPGPAGGLLDMLTPLLDRNRDGSAIDDILGMAGQFLGRR